MRMVHAFLTRLAMVVLHFLRQVFTIARGVFMSRESLRKQSDDVTKLYVCLMQDCAVLSCLTCLRLEALETADVMSTQPQNNNAMV